jgi:hypothetical protein
MAELTGSERRTVEEARVIGKLRDKDLMEFTGDEDKMIAYAVAFGRAQWELIALLAIIDRLTADGKE